MNEKEYQLLVSGLLLLAFNSNSLIFSIAATIGVLLVLKSLKNAKNISLNAYAIIALNLMKIVLNIAEVKTIYILIALVLVNLAIIFATFKLFKEAITYIKLVNNSKKFTKSLHCLVVLDLVLLVLTSLPLYAVIFSNDLAISIATMYLNQIFQSVLSLLPIILKYFIMRPYFNFDTQLDFSNE